MASLTARLDRWFYVAADDDGTEIVIPETLVLETDDTLAGAKLAIDNATWNVAKLYLVNLRHLQIKDVSAQVAELLLKECQAAGETVEESVYRDFILDHIPASFDVGYRGPVDRYAHLRTAAE